MSWAAAQFADGSNVTHYTVARYDDATDTAQTVGASCNGVVTGLTCAENNVSAGDWYYTVTPLAGELGGRREPRQRRRDDRSPVVHVHVLDQPHHPSRDPRRHDLELPDR